MPGSRRRIATTRSAAAVAAARCAAVSPVADEMTLTTRSVPGCVHAGSVPCAMAALETTAMADAVMSNLILPPSLPFGRELNADRVGPDGAHLRWVARLGHPDQRAPLARQRQRQT